MSREDILWGELTDCVKEIARLKGALPEPPAPPEDCCCNAEWRGRLCAYHQGFEDGWEALREAVEG